MDMFQKILLFITFFFFLYNTTFANQKIEDVFTDINSNYKYLSELQLLYNKGIIKPNLHNKFKPYELLTREEFVWILMETNCEQCIKPNTHFDLIQKFKDSNVYYDVNNNSNYNYCIQSADNKWYIQWYREWTTCENGVTKSWEIPFCPYNTIIFEEALAIVMRAWNILSQQQANNFINSIYNWNSYPELSDDVKPKNNDESIYDFYPYFYKADEFKIVEYNNIGEKIEYSLIEKKSNKYYPKKSINREEFLKLAVFSLKNSNCIAPSNWDISGKINIYDGETCESWDDACNDENDFDANNPIDLVWEITTSCALGFSDETSYKWVIHNITTNTEVTQTGKFLDNHIFTKVWKYKIDLYITDLCNNASKISKNISISWNTSDEFSAAINKEYTNTLTVDFSSLVEWNTGEYNYIWDFGDGNRSNEKNPSHTYDETWIYDVTLTVIDKNWIEKQIPTTVNFIDNDFNVAISTEVTTIWSTDFTQLYGLTNSDNPNLTYSWDLGDGNTSNEQNPLHNYAPWTYTVILTVTDQHGNEKQVTTIITISDWNFTVNASVDTQEVNGWLQADFTPLVDWWVWPFTYNWDLWDGTTSTEENPSHIYTEPWMYTVELIVTDSEWNTQSTYTQVIYSNWTLDTQIDTIPQDTNEYIFNPSVEWWVWPFTYIWDLWDGTISTEENPSHEYQEDGTYTVNLITTDSNGLISSSQTTIVVISNQTSDLNISVSAEPITWPGPLVSNLWVKTQWGTWPFIYTWDFWDGNSASWKDVSHTFFEPGTYTVIVTVVDANWVERNETIIITVTPWISNIDTDQDGILDRDDKCPEIFWEVQNDWCPIFEEICNSDNDCNENSKCGINSKGISTCIPISIKNNCEYNGESTVFWNVICNTCPCQNTLDFNATLRNCDVVFPAITSPDWTEIFSKGNYYQIKK